MRQAIVVTAALAVLTTVALAEDVGHSFLVAGFRSGTVFQVNATGEVEKLATGAKSVQDVWRLPSGNILYSFNNGVREIDSKTKKTVWEFVDKESKKLETHSCQPLPNGNVLLCQCGPKRLLEVNNKGEIVKEIKLKTTIANTHLQFRMARLTQEGTYLVGYFKEGKAEELDAEGKVLKTFTPKEKGFKTVHSCVRLDNGHTLLTTGYGGATFEFDKDGTIIWEFTKNDVPEEKKKEKGRKYCTYAAGVQRLPNGNTVISYYSGNPQFVEVTPDKKIVWEYFNPKLSAIASQTRLDSEGDPLKFEVKR